MPPKAQPSPQGATQEKKVSMRVLGIDPGYGRMGYGLIEEVKGEIRVLDFGCVETKKTEKSENRLKELYEWLSLYLAEKKPMLVAIESLFFSKNVKTALAVAEARGVLMLAIAKYGAPMLELSPQEVKLAVTGYGSAEKKQVQQMVARLLSLSEIPEPDDAADALALAIAASQMHKFLKRL